LLTHAAEHTVPLHEPVGFREGDPAQVDGTFGSPQQLPVSTSARSRGWHSSQTAERRSSSVCKCWLCSCLVGDGGHGRTASSHRGSEARRPLSRPEAPWPYLAGVRRRHRPDCARGSRQARAGRATPGQAQCEHRRARKHGPTPTAAHTHKPARPSRAAGTASRMAAVSPLQTDDA